MKNKSLVMLPALLSVSGSGLAEEFRVLPGIALSYLHTDSEQLDSNSNLNSVTVTPSLIANYTSAKLQTRLSVSHDQVHRRLSFDGDERASSDTDKGFTSFDYSGSLEVVENVFSLNFNGTQGYQNIDPSGIFFDQRSITDLDDIAKTKSHSAGFQFVTPKPKYFGMSASGRYSEISSDRQTNTTNQLDDKNTSLGVNLYSGERLKSVRWTLNSSYTKTERITDDNVESRRSSGSVYFGLFNDISLVVTGSIESNDLSNNEALSQGFGNDTYGAGLSWTGRAGRRIDVTYNNSEEQNGETKNFVGFDINWPFSTRTSLAANYGRRFFGESKTFSFEHSMRRIRTSISYNESVTTYSRLVTEPQALGLLVCSVGDTTLNSCYIPESIDYVPGPEEEASEIIGLVGEINEQVTLSKRFLATIGYDFRKLSVSANFSRSNIDYLESDRQQIEKAVGLTANFKYSPRTSLTFSTQYSEFERNLSLNDDESIKSSLDLNYKFTERLVASLGFDYVDRESDEQVLNQTDRRLSLEISYQFK